MPNKQPAPPRRPERRARRKRQLAERRASRKARRGISLPLSQSAVSRLILTAWMPGARGGACDCATCEAMERMGIESDADGVAEIPIEQIAEFDALVEQLKSAA